MDPNKKTMMAMVLEEFKKPAELKEIPIPVPKDGEVLIRVESAPINPSDLSFLKGHYSSNKPLPCVPGFEGSGVVVASGGGIQGWSLVGKRVALASQTQWGTFAEYCTASVNSVISIPDNVSFNQAACTFANPLTAIAMLDVVKDANAKAIVSTAAASAVGRMISRYFKENSIKVINVVRRIEQVELLKKEGAEIVLDSTQQDFEEQLKAACTAHKATILFDAVAGDLTGQILKNMESGSTAYVYGFLSLKPCVVDVGDLIFRKQTLTGFWLNDWIKQKNPIVLLYNVNKLKDLIQNQLKTEVSMENILENTHEAVKYYAKNMTKGKVILKPQLRSLPSEIAPSQPVGTQEKPAETQEKPAQQSEKNAPKEEQKKEQAAPIQPESK